MKVQGMCKLNTYCTALIKTMTEQTTSKVQVEVCNTHYGHTTNLGHLRLPDNVRLSVAGQLLQGVSFQHILDKVRDSVGTDLKQVHLLSRKDIGNIEKSYHLNTKQRDKNDATSVDCWVKEMMEKEERNPVIVYKPQGCPQSVESNNMCDDDFLICLQTPMQASMIKKFGHQRIICIDSTHGTNSYNFSLVTLVVVDEFGEGYPVGWCLSNSEDKYVLHNFFTAVKKRVGFITPQWFMSNDAEQFYNAWRSVFGEVNNKLLCTWHVDRAWREKLSLIKDKQTQVAVYHNLRVLLEEKDIQKFQILLTKTIQQLQLNDETYVYRKQQWARCYRQGSFINTNMYVEAFHRVLKYIYMNGRINKRVDNCINTLMKITRDKAFERLIKLTKGKKTKRLIDIHKRHLTSKDMTVDSVEQVEHGVWDVT